MDDLQHGSGLAVDEDLAEERPQLPWIVGLLVLIFGALGTTVSAMNLYLGVTNLGNTRSQWTSVGFDMGYIYFVLVVGFLVAAWMIFIGVKLLSYKDSGRRHFDYYLIYFVLWTLGTSVYQYLSIPEGFGRQVILADMLPELLGKAVMMLLFLGCRHLLNKQEVKNWLS